MLISDWSSDVCSSDLLCDAGDEAITFRARKGVVLSCGGFEQNEEMILNHLKAYPIYFYGATSNTGDGIRMAQAVGADLWHMNKMIGDRKSTRLNSSH